MHDFTKGNIGKPLTLFAIPIILGSFFMQLYNIVNAVVVGSYIGLEALAAVGAAYPIIFLLMSLTMGIASGGTVLVAQYMGAGDANNVRKSIDTTYLFLFISSIAITIIGIICSPFIYKFTHLPSDVFPDAVTYLQIYLLGTVFSFGFNGTSAILRGMGDSKTPLFFLVGSNIINLFLSILFICVFHWGVEASAWASVISQATACIALYYYLNAKKSLASLQIRKLQWNNSIFKSMLRIGLPTGFQQSFIGLGQVALMTIVNGFGTIIVAAFSAAMRIDALATMPGMNFSQALTTFTGQNMGAGKMDRVTKALRVTLLINIGISLIMALVFVIFGEIIMSWFSTDINVINEGYHYLLICGPLYCIFSAMFTFTGLFRGAGDTLVPMFITLFSLWLFRIPGAYILAKYFGSTGIWMSIPIGWLIGFIGSIIYYRMGKWKNKKIRAQMVEPPVSIDL